MKYVLRLGERVETQARVNASGQIIGIKTHRLLDHLRTSPVFRGDEPYVEVGTTATNERFAYPAFHDIAGAGMSRGGGQRPWLTSALREVFQGLQ